MPSVIRVFLLDDHRLVLDGLQQLLERAPDVRVCGTACTCAEARALLRTARPDVLVADLSLPDGDGLDLIDDPVVRELGCRLVVLSMRDEAFYAPLAIRRGARGFVAKSSAGSEVLAAIRTVHAGQIHVSPEVATTLIERGTRPRAAAACKTDDLSAVTTLLSRRERGVFELIGRGFTAKEIAASLRISSKTVDTHRQRIRRKLRVPSAARLATLAVLAAATADQPLRPASP